MLNQSTSNTMKAIVIIYKGETPLKSEIDKIVNNAEFIKGDATVHIVSEKKLAGMLVSSAKQPKINTEEGDSAAIYVAGMCRDTTDITTLSIDVITNLTKSVTNPSPELEAFVRACSTIAQRNPISLDIRKKYDITDNTIEVITRLYQAWANGQN